jgi:hypothetical protein
LLPAAPALAASCPDNNWSNKDGRTGKLFDGNGINIRTEPSTSCASRGHGQASHNVVYHCYKPGEGGTWTHLKDTTTGVQGWTKDSLLKGYGSPKRC